MRTGSGILPLVAAAVLLREKPETIRRWAFGHARTRPHRRVEQPPLIGGETPSVRRSRELTFLELVELIYVRALRHTGVGCPAIRAAGLAAGRFLGTPHPFAMRPLYADPLRVFEAALGKREAAALTELRGAGTEIEKRVRPYLGQLDFAVDGVASRWWPMGRQGGVVVDPAIASGAPVVDGTGIRADTIARAVDELREKFGALAVQRAAKIFEIERDQVNVALGFEAWLLEGIGGEADGRKGRAEMPAALVAPRALVNGPTDSDLADDLFDLLLGDSAGV